VTEKIRIEKLLIENEKMKSIGGLAAGMAHEINNPLAIIANALQNTIRRFDPSRKKNTDSAEQIGIDLYKLSEYLHERKITAFLDNSKEACLRAADIVKNMLMFSRKSNSELSRVDLIELMENSIKLGSSDYDMKKKYDFKFIDIIREYDHELPKVLCFRSEIEQVLLNLFKNAAQAMEVIDEGDFKPQLHVRLIKEENHARIEIENNGPIIPRDIKKRIFEPFFTTKPAGIGTGLGLSVSYMIITQNHNGTMEVESEPGRSTNFIIRLPLERKKEK